MKVQEREINGMMAKMLTQPAAGSDEPLAEKLLVVSALANEQLDDSPALEKAGALAG